MIDLETFTEIRRLHFGEHWPVGTIATHLGVHEDVVTRAIGPVGPGPIAGPRRPSLVDAYKEFIEETLEKYPRLVSTRIYDMARARGYLGSPRTLRRFVTEVRPAPRTEAFLRIQRLPGEQAQVDWGHVGKIAVPGGERALWVFVMVLAFSRAIWAELVLDLSVGSLRRSLLRAAEFFHGVPRQWLFDNPKTIVLERRGDIVRYNPAIIDLCGRLHVEPRLCAVRKPNQKGGVERSIRYLKDRFFAARTIRSVDDGNRQLLQFIAEVTMKRPHPTLPGRTVEAVFTEERPYLLTLPDVMPESSEVHPVVIDKTAFARFDTNLYSVPPAYVRRTLTVSASDAVVKIVDGENVVAEHKRSWGKKQVSELAPHRREILEEKRAAAEPKGRERLEKRVPGIERLISRWAADGRYLGSLIARTLKLLELYGDRVVAEAVADLLARGQHDFGALSILCEQRRRAPRPSLPLALGDHVPERDVVPHDLGGYDD